MHKSEKLFITLFVSVIIFFSYLLFLQNKDNTTNIVDTEINKKHQIITSILPQVQIIKRIAGDSFRVTALVPSGFSPETYELTSKDIKTISEADIYFRIGYVDFEKINISKLRDINPKMKIVDTSSNNKLRNIESNLEISDSDEHTKDEIDPHVWLSPKMVKQQAEVIKDTLVEMFPDNKLEYENNYKVLATELDKIDQELRESFLPIKGETMLVYHPAFGYLADEYGFAQQHIEIGGKEPSILELQTIINEAKEKNVHVVFVQKQFSVDSAQSIADNINGVVVQVDPLDPDYLSNIRNLAKVISSKVINEQK